MQSTISTTIMDKQTTSTGFVVRVAPLHRFLQGPRTPQQVKKLGYGFTDIEIEIWTFPTEAKAQAKARVIERHMSWAKGACTVKPATQGGQA